ncbi:MAG: flagellar motor switch protein FliN [Oscillospiraceae bacterium]
MKKDNKVLTGDELDAIGEILNISMGAAATAVSTMLERQVVITTPKITQNLLQNVDFSEFEPAIVVKINYIEGLSGTNVIVIRRKDMGIILNLLMGNDYTNTEDYEFDEMSMSAACEVMNQMMGSSATAMSEMINQTINISTPLATLAESANDASRIFDDIEQGENVVSVSFKMTIKETLDTNFSSVMPLELARAIVEAVNGGVIESSEVQQEPAAPSQKQAINQPQQNSPPPPQTAQQASAPTQQTVPPQPDYWPPSVPVDPQYMPPAEKPPNTHPYQPYQPPFDPAMQYAQYQQPLPQPPYGQAANRQYPYGQYSQYPEQQQNTRYVMPSLNVKQPEFPDFSQKSGQVPTVYSSNMNLLMGVQLEVSVVIGRAKQKIKDVLDLGQGSIIELDRQTGSPAEIVVNGQLIAYGDVVVVGDNFGIRITEIVGTKELIDSIEKNNK